MKILIVEDEKMLADTLKVIDIFLTGFVDYYSGAQE